MLVNFNLEGLEEKDVREIKYLLQTINDTLEGGIWHTNIKNGAITTNKLSVTSLSAITANLGTITAGNITLDTSGFLRSSGKDNYADTATGYWLGYDTDAYKLNIGDETHYLKWDGTKIIIGDMMGSYNVAMGHGALDSNDTGYWNVAVGSGALYSNTDGMESVAVGRRALFLNTDGYNNTAVGCQALYSTTDGDSNTAVGWQALYSNTTGDYNIAIGHQAGENETSSYKLYIDVSDTSTPLIYGEFDNNIVTVHGNLGIWTKLFGTNGTGIISIWANCTPPASSPAAVVQLYAEDVSSSAELKVRDEATNVTVLSPHAFELFKPDKNDPFPWSYHSVNYLIGKKVNADISGALRELENLTGKKFLYYEDVDKLSLSEYLENKKEGLITNYIEENTTKIEVEKNEAWGEIEVEEQDTNIIIKHDIRYKFDDKTGEVKEIKVPIYKKKIVLKNKLKKGYKFNEETGKFLKTIKPTEEEAEKEIKKELIIPDWIEDRL